MISFADVYLYNYNNTITVLIDKTKQESLKSLSFADILADIRMLLIAGMETTSNSMEYILIQLANHSKLQQDIYNELVDQLKNVNVSLDDSNDTQSITDVNKQILEFDTSKINFNHLHLFRAFIWECMRLQCVANTGLPHWCNDNVDFIFNDKEFVIPKNCVILFNIVYANTKSDCWKNNENNGNTEQFCLSHWLKKNDKINATDGNKNVLTFVKNENFVGFGVGQRDCVGQQLAVNIIYRAIAHFVLRFKICGLNNQSTNNLSATSDGSMNITFKTASSRVVHPTIPLKLVPRDHTSF